MLKKFMSDFKEFLMRGNVIDLAIAFVIGAAFSGIVKSLVDNLIMPPIGLLLHGVDFTNLYVILKSANANQHYNTLAAAQKAGAVTLNYGLFINSIMSFLIVGFAMFMVIRLVNKIYPKPPAAVTTKTCKYCATDIPLKATRCPNCTSEI